MVGKHEGMISRLCDNLNAFFLDEVQSAHGSSLPAQANLGLAWPPRTPQYCGIERDSLPDSWQYQVLGERSQRAFLIAIHEGRPFCFVFLCKCSAAA